MFCCCERELAPHNERAENDKWIGKLYFYYMKNHLYCAINARSEYEKLRNCWKMAERFFYFVVRMEKK